jgi:hypothetical protein
VLGHLRSNAIAYLALIVALSGTAYAAKKVNSKQIKDNAVQSVDVKDENLTGSDVKDGSLGTGDVADGVLGSADLADGGVNSADIANGAVGAGKIAGGAVGSGEIADGGVGAADIASGGVGSGNLAGGAVGSAAIADGAVAGSEVADGSLTAADLADPTSLGSPAIIAGTVDLPGVITSIDVHPMGLETTSDSRFAVAPVDLEIRDLRAIADPATPGALTILVATGDVTNIGSPTLTGTPVTCPIFGSTAGLAECDSGGATATIPAGNAFSVRIQESPSSVTDFIAYSFTARAG